MHPLPIVKHFDIVKDAGASSGPAGVQLLVYTLGFQAGKEALHGGVIVAVSPSAHTGRDVMKLAQRLILSAGVLTPPVRMMDETWRRFSRTQSHLQSIQSQLAAQAFAECPADDPSRVQVEDCCEIEPTFTGCNVSDVGQPHFVRRGGPGFLLPFTARTVRRVSRIILCCAPKTNDLHKVFCDA